jgi:hypothetical protein
VFKKIAIPVLIIAGAFLFFNVASRGFLSLADENQRRKLEDQVQTACNEAEQYQMDREQIAGDIAYFEEMLALPTTDELESFGPSEEREIFQEQLEQSYRALRAADDCSRLTEDYQSKYSE